MTSPTSNSQLPTSRGSAAPGEVLIRAENVGKKFCRDLKKSLMYGVQDIGCDLLGVNRNEAGLRKKEFWANEGISFELKRGECLGLIGKNGAGKTTLLKMLNGLIKPDQGSITMHGRVGALIALGAGFNPILTGRENIYINGAVLGLSKKEIKSKMDEIIDFAEIPEFIDTPVQNYSSGMQVRLGFAISTTMNPDILLLDEVLAVGDLNFRLKCYNRIDRLRENTAVILVSHSLEHVSRICTEVLLLNSGKPKFQGDVSEGLVLYENEGSKNTKAVDNSPTEYKDNCLDVVELKLVKDKVLNGNSLTVEVETASKVDISGDVRFTIYDDSKNIVIGTAETKLIKKGGIKLTKIKSKYSLKLNNVHFRPGGYSIVVSIFESKNQRLIFSNKGNVKFEVICDTFSEAPLLQPIHLELIS